MKNLHLLIISALFLINANAIAQDDSIIQKKEYTQWSHGDLLEDGVVGISLTQAYEFVKENKKVSKPIIVAIIDSGIDTAHEDIRANLWVNPKEIPYNDIDDDGNGFVDDIYGWNFIGNSKGENVNADTWELTRLYRIYKRKYDGKTKKEIPKAEVKKYEEWLVIKSDFETKLIETRNSANYFKNAIKVIESSNEILKTQLGANYTSKDVENLEVSSERVKWAKDVYSAYNGNSEMFESALKHYNSLLEKKLNPRFYTRQIVGDNVSDINDTLYGNYDVTAETSSHGTGVAGIVGAVRDNDIGIQGIADNVQLMAVRVVPGGDERDKDVALAIRYAVNNGARIINGSFGKSYSPNKAFVDSAIRYAERHNVLIIHASGNEGLNNDKVTHFPTPEYAPKKYVNNWIDVGASSKELGMKLPAGFSNYGRKSVDIFAPGVDIRSTSPKNKYSVTSGTSDASPVVAGVAALVLSYYPHLTAVQLREIILESSVKYPKEKVVIPGSEKKTSFKKLSTTAGVVNAYQALKLAEERYGNK